MAYWLFKSEPNTWSWKNQLERAEQGEPWDGVRNHLAQKHMRAMKQGDLGFFYHSVNEKRIVGIVEVIKEFFPDPTDDTGRWNCVQLKAIRTLRRPVTLEEIKTIPTLEDMILVKNSRLSVQPVTPEQWQTIVNLSKSN